MFDFAIIDSDGCKIRVESLSSDYKACYGDDITANVFVLTANPDGDNNINEQINAISQEELEALKLIVVRGYVFKVDDSGYYLTTEDAIELLDDKAYAAYLFNEKGELTLTSYKVLDASEISSALK
jgi:hypothetical protein